LKEGKFNLYLLKTLLALLLLIPSLSWSAEAPYKVNDTTWIIEKSILKFPDGRVRFLRIYLPELSGLEGLIRDELEFHCKNNTVRYMGEVFQMTANGDVMHEIGERDFILDLNEAENEDAKYQLEDLMELSCYMSGDK